MTMLEWINIECPNCGGDIEVELDVDTRMIEGYCRICDTEMCLEEGEVLDYSEEGWDDVQGP